MLLFLCYVCPPIAVLAMGRPFSAVLNFFLCAFMWVPGVKHALACYADRKVDKVANRVVGAINRPAWAQQEPAPRGRQPREVVVIYDNPHVGKNGTYFRAKR